MYVDKKSLDLLDASNMGKMLLAKKVGASLKAKLPYVDRVGYEREAHRLSQDNSPAVRSVIAFELTECDQLPETLLNRIIKDQESVCVDFLISGIALTDTYLARRIPGMRPYAHTAVAQRPSLGDLSLEALVEYAGEDSILYIVRNDSRPLNASSAYKLVTRFSNNKIIMDQLSARRDLPIDVVKEVIKLTSHHCRTVMERVYGIRNSQSGDLQVNARLSAIWSQVEAGDQHQVFGLVKDLKREGQLSHAMVLEMGGKGSLPFFEGSLALFSEMPLIQVRKVLKGRNPREFLFLMKKIKVKREELPIFAKLAKTLYHQDIEVQALSA